MGLDAVDFVMAVEEEFGIEIPDAEVENILTVGELVDFVYAILPDDMPNHLEVDIKPYSDNIFDDVRKVLIEQVGVDGAVISSGTLLEDLILREGRKEVWKRVRRALGVSSCYSTNLTFSRGYSSANGILAIIAFILLFLFTISLRFNEWLALVILFLVPMIINFFGLSFIWPRVFPDNCSKVEDLVREVKIVRKKQKYSKSNTSKEDVFYVVARLLEDYAISSEEIYPETRFVEDLGF